MRETKLKLVVSETVTAIMDVSLFWVVFDSSSLWKVGTMIFGFKGRNSNVDDDRKTLRFLL